MSAVHPPEKIETLADLLARLGGVPLDRIRFRPAPGTATEQDVIDLRVHEDRLFELVEGVLVEKPMGFRESRVTALIIQILGAFMEEKGLGIVAGPDGLMRITEGVVRVPDVSVVLWDRLPGRKVPADPIPSLTPDLAVEVLSPANTRGEIERKVSEYFEAGTRCAWIVDPARLIVRIYDSATDFKDVGGGARVTAEPVLPGFTITVESLFRRAGV
jgi:Uma2 family endonuclease